MVLLFVAFAAMLLKDALGAVYVRAIGRKRYVLAGSADGTSDVFTLLSIGVTGAAVAKHGISAWSAAAVVLIWIASVLGTLLGAKIEERL